MAQPIEEKHYFLKEDRWNGGMSEDSRIGDPGSFRWGIGNEIRRDTGYIGVAKKPINITPNNEVTDPIYWIEEDPDSGEVYYYGGRNIYKEVDGHTSVVHVVTEDGANAQGLQYFNRAIFYRSPTKLGRYDLETNSWDDSWQTGLSTTRKWGPMCNVKNVLLVGHGRYIGTVDDVNFWIPQALTLPPGYFVRSIFRAGSYAVILATFGEDIEASDKGMMFLWDTTSDVYNDFIPIEGNPQAGIAHKNKITIIAGMQPTIQQSLGGQTEIVQGIPHIEDGKTVEIYPGAIDIWRNMVHFGISAGTSETVIRAIYNYGSKNSRLLDSLNPEFPTSQFDESGDMADLLGSNVKITACKRIGTTFRFAVEQDGEYWVDEIDLEQYQSQSIRRSLAFDRRSPYEKSISKMLIELKGQLQTGESVTVKISPDPYGDDDFSDTTSVVSLTETYDADEIKKTIELPLTAQTNEIRSRDIHYEIRLMGTGSTRPSMKRIWGQIMEDQDQL